jgi:Lrp/AsnC family transcriptional regulator, leucine-responsive regulatory protein
MRRRIQSALDPVGWKILTALQENARLSFTELGRQVGLTGPAVAERVRRLEEAGVIRGYRVELGFERLGLPIAALIRVSAPEEKYPPLKAGAAVLPEVLECHHVTGTDSLVLKVVATSVRHLEAVIETLGRWGTPATSIILSSPVDGQVVSEPPTSWPLMKAALRKAATAHRPGPGQSATRVRSRPARRP